MTSRRTRWGHLMSWRLLGTRVRKLSLDIAQRIKSMVTFQTVRTETARDTTPQTFREESRSGVHWIFILRTDAQRAPAINTSAITRVFTASVQSCFAKVAST